MTPWQQLRQAALEAARAGDVSSADALIAQLWTETKNQGQPTLDCDTHFVEGMVRDALKQFDAAEAAFQAALAIDRKTRGDIAAADTIHSIGLVRRNRGNHAGAFAAFRESAELVRTHKRFRLTHELSQAGYELLMLQRYDDAAKIYGEAYAAGLKEPLTPVTDIAGALNGAGESLRRGGNYSQALARYTRATQLSKPNMHAELATAIARVWHNLGIVSRHGLGNSQVQAAFAFWFAVTLGDEGTKGNAAEQLAQMPERALCVGDPMQFRVVYNGSGHVHVASAQRGFFHVNMQLDAEPGDIVHVELGARGITSVTLPQ